ncbi:GreA/GreB family elongation factor [Streptomyces diastatochromogenes]|uniref:Nucleoside diphosphate kinase regulator n=1 Tax=Streptomyces diastatochromogenes TaxID=42236 RepID=A0A233S6R0_STRDA|nr:GreA/GreB family elongation factor [Streptomyces diastatochromogenes]MCZ0991466.1 GreA/GreB family elongation factor [Streptomyces diastatochromogenes]OXY91304.1 nucleoside diphosphate kinase regulator [Streptomyces diastatochromogenes]
MTSEPEPISEVARQALEKELAEVRAERASVAATLRDGDTTGDRADEADELQRVDALDRLDARISQITTRLRQAAEAGRPSTDVVGVGSTVTVRFQDGTEDTFQIGATAEVLDPTLITADSPLGHALLGHRAGDSVSYRAPEGRLTAMVVSLGGAPGGQG